MRRLRPIRIIRCFCVSKVTNEQITACPLRVIYTDPATQQTLNSILTRENALDLANDFNADLILGIS